MVVGGGAVWCGGGGVEERGAQGGMEEAREGSWVELCRTHRDSPTGTGTAPTHNKHHHTRMHDTLFPPHAPHRHARSHL